MKKTVWTLVILLILIILAIVTGLGLYVKQAMKPMPASSPKTLVIAPGTSPSKIAELLEREGLIHNAQVFTYYLKYKQQGSRFQAGSYEMAPGIPLEAIIDTLNNGLIIKEQGIKLTVPEGYTVRQIAEKVSQQFGMDANVFLQAAEQREGFKARIFAEVPEQPQLRNRLEGYLFPETYEWNKDIKVEDMLDNMMLELDKKLASLPEDWQQKMLERGQNLHQMLTVASLIEREAILDEERPLISGIIQNRLKINMMLQIDATVQYLFDKPKDRLFEKDLQVDSPYNTYNHKGLPPGPIASPSLASIKAAIFPVESPYLYYVTKKDGTKAHYFAETYAQHQNNISLSKKNESALAK
ncbi:endolytic transglycosylase MltG [Paenibacillus sp. S3N08]|uniref:Endolytic murein transglycosylase n=1 Tax=Paenibacillus agricola TaxID=2716264 RepID=A0ABX0J4I6_9BACL|nr:endolytic transglycosylase MltG [Paenibacillus agricola]